MAIDLDNLVVIAPSGLMDVQNAALYLGVTVGVVRHLRRTRQVKCLKVGKSLRFRKADLDNYIEDSVK